MDKSTLKKYFFRKEEDPIPDSLSWDHISGDIMSNLSPAPQRRKRFPLIWWWMLGSISVAVVLLGGLYYFTGSTKTSILAKSSNVIQPESTAVSQKESNNSLRQSNEKESTKSKTETNTYSDPTLISENAVNNNIVSTQEVNQKDQLSIPKDKNTLKASATTSGSMPNVLKMTIEEKNRTRIVTEVNSSFNQTRVNGNMDHDTEVKSMVEPVIALSNPAADQAVLTQSQEYMALDIQPLEPIDIRLASEEREVKSPALSKMIEIASDRPDRWHMSLASGLSTLKLQTAEDDLAHISESYTARRPGYFIELSIQKPISKRWSMSTGVLYQVHRERLSYYETMDTLVDHQQYHQVINSLTGEIVDSILVNTQLSGYRYVDIRHTNQYASLSVPLSLNYNFDVGKWGIHLSPGAYLTLASSQNGRTLVKNPASDNGLLMSADFSQRGIDKMSIGYGAQLGLGLHYPITHTISVGTQFNMMRALSDWTSQSGTIKPTIWRLGLFATYSFD